MTGRERVEDPKIRIMGQTGGNFRKLGVEGPITSASGRRSHKQEYVQEVEKESNVSEPRKSGEEKGASLSKGQTKERQSRSSKRVSLERQNMKAAHESQGMCTPGIRRCPGFPCHASSHYDGAALPRDLTASEPSL